MKHPAILASAPLGRVALTRKVIRYEISIMRRLWSRFRNLDLENVLLNSTRVEMPHKTGWLYALCRQIRPRIVLETGVRAGSSSSFILQALADNNEGSLYSIDLPNSQYEIIENNVTRIHSDVLPKGTSSGFAIPRGLRSRWTLIEGDSRAELPKFLSSCGKIGVFFHDSKHTYEHMMFEFVSAFENLSEGGILAADDSNWNSAFSDFCEKHRMTAVSIGNASFAVKVTKKGEYQEIGGLDAPRKTWLRT